MNMVKVLAVVAAVAIVIVIGAQSLGLFTNVGSPGPTPEPTPSIEPTSLTTADSGGNLEPGRYRAGDPFSVAFDLTLPGGYTLDRILEGEVAFSTDGPFIGLYDIESVFVDPCHPESGAQTTSTPPTGEELVATLTNLTGFEASEVSIVGIGARTAQHFTVSNSIDTASAGCTNGELLPLFVPIGGEEASTNGGTTQQVWVVDTGSRPIVVIGESQAADEAELDAIVTSLTFR